MRFAWTIVYVNDVAESVAFYEKAFGLTRRFVQESGDYAEMDTGETTLAFASNELGASNLPEGYVRNSPGNLPAGVELAFVDEEAEEALRVALANGAALVSEIEEKPWGQKVAYVRDIDGVLIEIATPVTG